MLTSCTTVLTTSKIDWNSSHVLEAMLQHRKANLNRDRAFARAMDLARRKEEP